MDVYLSESHQELRQRIREFAEAEIGRASCRERV